jgi:hypothetical protein
MRIAAIVLIAFLSATVFGQEKRIADIRLDDGSTVRVTLQQPSVEIQTKYGKLVVPVADIRRIEFGLHVPIDQQAAIVANVKRLGSIVHKERDAAVRDLIASGHFAAHALREACESPDKEIAQRADKCLRSIADSVPGELLTIPVDDVIHTTISPIHGRIVDTSLPVVSAHFGEVSLKVSGVRTLHVRHSAAKADLVLDATKYGSSLDLWYDTGVILERGMKLHIETTGEVDLWPQAPGQYMCGAKGYNTVGRGGQFMAGALIGKIGDGRPFYVGETFDGFTTEEGRLYLMATPSPWNNAIAGQYRVRVRTELGR